MADNRYAKVPLSLNPLALSAACVEDPSVTSPTPLSPRRQRARQREKMVRRAVRIVASPLPYAILVIFLAMVVMIFVDVMPISGLICVIAILMVLTVVLGNYWKNEVVWQEDSSRHGHQREEAATAHPLPAPSAPLVSKKGHSRQSSRCSNVGDSSQHSNHASNDCEAPHSRRPSLSIQTDPLGPSTLDKESSQHDEPLPYTREDRIDNLNEFFDDLFKSIDYSLLLIFLGTFIVIESMASTGIPKQIW